VIPRVPTSDRQLSDTQTDNQTNIVVLIGGSVCLTDPDLSNTCPCSRLWVQPQGKRNHS